MVYSIVLNGASQPGGQSGTALLPLFDLLNHDIEQEVSLTSSNSPLSPLCLDLKALLHCCLAVLITVCVIWSIVACIAPK